MNQTQNDLSCNQTKLDYLAMVKTSRVAFAHIRNELDRYLHQTHEIKPQLGLDFLAKLIKEEANELVIAAETMHTLEGGLSREELEIVNKPEVKDDKSPA